MEPIPICSDDTSAYFLVVTFLAQKSNQKTCIKSSSQGEPNSNPCIWLAETTLLVPHHILRAIEVRDFAGRHLLANIFHNIVVSLLDCF